MAANIEVVKGYSVVTLQIEMVKNEALRLQLQLDSFDPVVEQERSVGLLRTFGAEYFTCHFAGGRVLKLLIAEVG